MSNLFLKPSFGETAGVVRIATAKPPISFRGSARGPGYTNAASDGIVESAEKYFGGKPRYKEGVTHKRGKGTDKQAVFVAVQRRGQARSALIDRDKAAELHPWVQKFVGRKTHLMTDLTVVDRTDGAAVSAGNTDRAAPIFNKAAFVKNQGTIRAAKVIVNETTILGDNSAHGASLTERCNALTLPSMMAGVMGSMDLRSRALNCPTL